MARDRHTVRRGGIWLGVLLWVSMQFLSAQVLSVWAQAPTSTPLTDTTATTEPTSTPPATLTLQAHDEATAQTPSPTSAIAATSTRLATPTQAVTQTVLATPAALETPTTAATPTAPAMPTAAPTAAATPTAPPTPTVIPTALPTATPTPGTNHPAALVSDTAMPVGGTKSSDVLISFQHRSPDIRQVELHLVFDPAIVQVIDADANAANGTQIALSSLFAGSQVQANQVDNAAGKIVLRLTHADTLPVSQANGWLKVATITWLALAEGQSPVTIAAQTRFVTADKAELPIQVAYHGTVFVRAQGRIKGMVTLQGQTVHRQISISAVLIAGRVDRVAASKDGRFVLVTSHGEGFYTLTAYAPGYLTAESDSPVRVTMGTIVDAGQVTLLGGDANGDNRIDIRDLSFVAWHFDQYDSAADFNQDGVVDVSDLSLAASNFGLVGSTSWAVPGQATD